MCRLGGGGVVSSRVVQLLLQSERIMEYPDEINPLLQWVVQISNFCP